MSGILKAIIIEDDVNSAEVLAEYIKLCDFVELKGSFSSAHKALDYLVNHHTDVIFLDIELPGISGFEFVKSLEYKPFVVITSGKSNYAIDAFNYNVTDFLLKPISFERFKEAKLKVLRQYMLQKKEPVAPLENYFFVKSGSKTFKIDVDEIEYIEAKADYVSFKLANRSVLTLMNMKDVEQMVKPHKFVRVHRSFIVPLKRIETINGDSITIAGKSIPISKGYKEELTLIINNNKL